MFGIYLSQNFIKMHQIAPFKNFLGGACPQTPLASAA